MLIAEFLTYRAGPAILQKISRRLPNDTND